MTDMTPNTVARTPTEAVDFAALVREARVQRAMLIADTVFDSVRAVASFFRNRAERHRTLDELSRLDDRTLADIGLNRTMITAGADGIVAASDGANENRPAKAA
jgi:uncharacterized protein YjiS (DUF1127 family)